MLSNWNSQDGCCSQLACWQLYEPKRQWNTWVHCRANMDVLVSLGTNASYIYSIISILHHHFMHHHETGLYRPTDFFETSAMLITFILLGKYLEASAKGKTSEAIGALLNLTPPTAILLEEGDGEEGKGAGKVQSEKEVPTTLIHRGDMLKVGLCPVPLCSGWLKNLGPFKYSSGDNEAFLNAAKALLLSLSAPGAMTELV